MSRETSDWSLKRRSDSIGEEQFGDFEEDKDLDRAGTGSEGAGPVAQVVRAHA